MMHVQRVLQVCVFVLCAVLVTCASAQSMKIAVPATAAEKDSTISKETGRAPFFLVFDEKGDFLEALRNPAREQPGGISRTVVALLVEHNITMVVAESIGDKMKRALGEHQIEFAIRTGIADDTVMAIIQK